MNDKVLYAHYGVNGMFYIGIGTKKRPYTTNGRTSFWKAVAEKYGCWVKIIETGLSISEAEEKEEDLIDLIGRRIDGTGNLVNISKGGNHGGGRKGYKHTKEAIKKIGLAGIGRFYSKETRETMNASKRGVPKSRQHKNNLGKSLINTETGVVYGTITEASEQLGIKRTTLNAYLTGQLKNKKNIKYYE